MCCWPPDLKAVHGFRRDASGLGELAQAELGQARRCWTFLVGLTAFVTATQSCRSTVVIRGEII